jgi:uncharacterized protein YjiS (DUF1127 family)
MMSCTIEPDVAAAAAPLRILSWREIFRGAVAWVQACWQRQRERQQLLDYMAIDHRAAADIGMKRCDALEWANRPFWRD